MPHRRRAAKHASMRPRPEGRGEPAECGVQLGGQAASMRPRPEGRGEPESTLMVHRPTAALQCGHGPKAVENHARSAAHPAADGASMRPRPEGRGEQNVKADLDHAHMASMRPRPEGRGELIAKMGDGGEVTLLQCGHGPKAVENQFLNRVAQPDDGASMRPRPEGRGEHSRAPSAIARRSSASMRPRPEGRGEPTAPARGAWWSGSLQCGHGPKAVENGSRCKRCISRWLQRAVRAGKRMVGQRKPRKHCLIR